MTPQELKSSILQLAIQGKLVEQRPEEGTAEELYQQIQAEKQKLIKEGKIKKEKALPEIAEDEKPFDIPDSWKWVRVQDLFNVRSAMRIHQSDWQTSGIPFFRGRELVQLVNTGNADFEIYISRELYEQNKEKGGVPQKDDILISAVGTLGKVYIVQGTQEFYYKDAYILCLENIGKFYPKYIKRALESPYLQNEIRKDSMATTVAQLTIIKTKSLLVPLPPLAEQKRIVAKIEDLLPLIDRYEKAWSRLEEFNKRFPDDMQKSILQMAIQGKLVEQRSEEGTGEELYQQIQTEKLKLIKEGKIKKERPLQEIAEEEKPFDIPESWKWTRIKCISHKITDGTHHSPPNGTNGDFLYITAKNIKNNGVSINEVTYVSKEVHKEIYSRCNPEKGDILLIKDGATTGIVTVNNLDNPFSMLSSVALIKPAKLVDPWFFVYYIRSDAFYKAVRSQMKGTGITRITLSQIEPMIVPLPPLAEQKRIVAKIEELLPLCQRLSAHRQ